MGKRGQRKGGHEDNPNVPEATRIQISKRIEEFRLGNAEVYTFEPTLSNPERAWVHAVCRKTGMVSKSTGRGNQRCVSVYKSKKRKQGEVGAKKASLKDKESLTSLTFSDETKAVLRDLFTHYPPTDGEFGKETVRNLSAKISKGQGKQDGCFCLPSMTKDEIAKKADLLSSKINGTKHMRKISEGRSKLPIASFKDAITSTIESHQVVLIAGETGCGKTTQVPQFLLDYMWGKGEACKIVCTQPRRISAISVAERISYERGENVGESVGYKIRLESKGGKNSSIMFCTNGILLRVLIGMGTATSKDGGIQKIRKDGSFEITHIIVDEIHERDRFADFMLAILRDQLRLFPHLHLILMSATIDAERFSQYFNGCPIIRVPGFTYPVKTYYLEDVLSILKSTDDNHIGSAASTNEDANQLSEDDRIAMDDSINVALSSDEFEPLLELISAETTPRLYNYQHSLTGTTPLMVFAGNGSVGDVCMLLSFGADCDLRDKDGKTALDWAQQANQGEVADIIKTHKEKHNSKSQEEQQLLEKYLASVNPELIDTALIERLLKKICVDSEDGAVLVFLPGWDDINRTREALLASPLFRDSSKFLIISLHSMIPSMEQKKVFKRPAPGIRKIILSTNIAETAITIDDVVYVIDSGWMKEKSYDPYNNVSTLHSAWVSKASAKQREGRAGRCQAGICYHLFSRTRAAALPEFQVPEIKRMPIEELCLQVKLMDPHSKIVDFIQKTMDPPVFETIRNAIIVLQDIGALTHDEMLTELGQKMGSLPVHPSTSKMLFFAIMMNCLDPALTLACASDYRDPFILPMALEERKKAKAAKIELASLFGGLSDQLMVTAAFECWRHAKDKGQESQFCSRYFLSPSTMNMLFAMRQQLQKELTQNGFIPEDTSNCSLNAHDPGILHAVLVSGLYPMVGRLIPRKGRRAIVETASGAKVLLHPHSVNFKSFNSINNSPLIIYDEITRGDGGMYIKNCTAIGPYPLLLLANEMVVAPANDDGEESDEEEEISGSDDEEMELCGGKQGDRLMSSPDNTVSVVVDRWLTFESTALDVAQIYCLRERLSSAVLFKVKHPRKVLPPALGASVYAMACILSYDGLSGISQNAESMDSLESMDGSTGDRSKTHLRGKKAVGQNCGNSVGYLRSLMDDGTQRNSQPQLDNKKMANSHKKDPPSHKNLVSQRSTSTNPAQDHTGGGVLSKRGSFKRQRGSWPR